MLRPYIGSHRNRNYISNRLLPSSLLFNDYYFATIPLSKSFLPNQSKHRIYLANGVTTTNALQERVPIEYVSSPIPLDERQLHQEQKAKGFLSSSSSSPFLIQTAENTTPLTYYDRSSFNREQQKFRHNHQYKQQYSDWQLSNNQNKNHQSLLSEQSKRKQSSIDNHYFENNHSFASPSVLNTNHPSDLLTLPPILSPSSSHHTRPLIQKQQYQIITSRSSSYSNTNSHN